MASGAKLESELTEGSYPLSPKPQGVLFASLQARPRGAGISQSVVDCPDYEQP